MPKKVTVKKEFRVNPLSLTPGGSTVTVIKDDGTHTKYTNVKNPQAYINQVVINDPRAVGFEVNDIPVNIKF